jgi:N-acetylglucosaminyl-diphospho-decaprenol L-rhamnosyltransferase
MSYNDITIVITSFKSSSKLISCLNSIKSEIKVLVIENSDDKEFQAKLKKKYKNLECILAGENLGYAKGNNLGLSRVKTKFALIINPDVILDKDAIDNFFKSTQLKPEFAIIAPFIQEEKDIKKIGGDIKELIEVNNVKGFAMFMNIEQFKNVGFFDDNFFIYFEEIDLCRRLKNNGKKIYLDPNIRIFHEGGSSHNVEVNYQMELSRNWHWMWSTFYYNKKYNGFIISLFKIFPKLIKSLFKIILYSIFFNKFKMLIYFYRLSGILNSILCKKSWYRPKV